MRRLWGALLLLGLAWAAQAGQGPWFSGGVEEAFALAKKQEKPIFLYWGATWCPPCNEIKSQVFSQPRFAELVHDVVAVYLDGDSQAAQIWGERLQIAGYPTLLLLSPQGEELLRLNAAVTMSEFEQAFTAALAIKGPLAQALLTARQGKAAPAVWQALARADWEAVDAAKARSPEDLLLIKQELYEKVPESLVEEKALFAAGLLSHAATLANKRTPLTASGKKALEQVERQLGPLLDAVLTEPQAILAARALITFHASRTLSWADPVLSPDQLRAYAIKWIAAAELIRAHPNMSVETRLWAIYPSLDLYRFAKRKTSKLAQGQEVPLPAEMTEAIQAAVKLADHRAKTAYERQAVMAGAASLLQEVRDYDGAAALLTKELQTTASPWYYQLSLAHLEMQRGQGQRALAWSRQAKESAQGEATRLQWTASHLGLTAKLASKDIASLESLAGEYYELAFALPDGFLGRNKAQAEQVATTLAPLAAKHPSLASKVRAYQARCRSLANPSQTACQQHFAKALGSQQSHR